MGARLLESIMRRRDYELISAALKAAKPAEPTTGATDGTWDRHWLHIETWQETVVTVGEHLQADNPAFDQEIFAINCGAELT